MLFFQLCPTSVFKEVCHLELVHKHPFHCNDVHQYKYVMEIDLYEHLEVRRGVAHTGRYRVSLLAVSSHQ